MSDTSGSPDILTILLLVALCCMLPTLFRQQGQPAQENGSDSWYVRTEIQETYDNVVKESSVWKSEVESKKSRGISSILLGKKQAKFTIEQDVSPRLYRIRDGNYGEISFEFTTIEDGGTSVKATYDSKARTLIQNLKAKTPIKIPSNISSPKTCPSCGKQMMPEFITCPYCGTKLK